MTRSALRAWAGEKPMSTSIDICSMEGPVEVESAMAPVLRGESMSASRWQVSVSRLPACNV